MEIFKKLIEEKKKKQNTKKNTICIEETQCRFGFLYDRLFCLFWRKCGLCPGTGVIHCN